MLTIFSTPKPFRGHSAVIQRNAIRSWTLLHPDQEVILFGDEEGAAETAREFGICHEPTVLRNEFGTKFLNYLFDRAQQIARHNLLCYVNCDVILMQPFRRAVERVAAWRPEFLMVGQRWDLDIAEPWDFQQHGWEHRLHALALQAGVQRPPVFIDYFVFSRGLYRNILPFVIGRIAWDRWLVWKARSLKVPVVDATPSVIAVHQNHDYSYHPLGQKGVWDDEQARRNFRLAGGVRKLYSIAEATHRLTPEGIERRFAHWFVPSRRVLEHAWCRTLSAALRLSRPVRHRFGLHQDNLARWRARIPWPRSR